MRKIVNSTFITLDGAIEDPHLWPSLGGDDSQESFDIHVELINQCDAVLMGRRTYESFASAWPTRSGDVYSDRINAMEKLVVSSALRNPTWNNTTVIARDLVAEVTGLKQRPGKDIVQYGIGQVTYALLEHGLLDELRLWVHPLILGNKGPQVPHFRDCLPTHLNLVASRTLPNGIAILNYHIARQI
ncbi:MAG TPA: dihydrofolate reductase family protein [Blastocatellia bacterium]|nr:dihydrofolate reductase family protein [Blastocatellia bacterium]